MAFNTIERIKSWSPSRLGDYEKCPRMAFYKHVKRLPDPGNKYSQRGTALHAEAEKYVTGKVDAIHPELGKVTRFLENFRKGHQVGVVKAELKMAFDENWRVCEWTYWKCWLRIIIDVVQKLDDDTIRISDWKTGKLKRDDKAYADQTNLYSVCGLSASLFNALEAKSQLIFVDHGIPIDNPKGSVTMDTLRHHQMYWERKVERMMEDDTFATNPGWGCQYCAYRKAVGGPCEFGVGEVPTDERF